MKIMDLILILIALGLATDSFTVSVAKSMANKSINPKKSILMAFYFGFFQGFMPIVGYYLGTTIIDAISAIDHWIAFSLLLFVGGKMIYESRMRKKDSDVGEKTMLMLAIATSIDAFAVGLTFSFIKINIWEAALIIGIITFVLSIIGCTLGNKFGKILGSKVEVIGGIVLILIGFKILFEHLGFL